MTREEQIKQAAYSRYAIVSSPVVFKAQCNCFIEGAKWADQHPSADTVKNIICYALKYTSIMLAEDLENGVEWELLIEKAMKMTKWKY